MADKNEFEENYSNSSFWDKLKSYAKSAGYDVVEKALWLYFAAEQPNLPGWAKATIYSALGYFITPIDAIADITPAVGYSDDLGVLAIAIATVIAYIDDGVKQKTENKMNDWFKRDK